MSNYDPRLERIVGQVRSRWSALSTSQQDAFWQILRFAHYFGKRRFHKVQQEQQLGNHHELEVVEEIEDLKVEELAVESSARVVAISPKQEDWSHLSKSYTKKKNPLIDVIIPVYDGYSETLRCIYSVLSTKSKVEFNLVVINDLSPNEELTKELRKLYSLFGFEYIENSLNLGFVKTMNKGMSLHPDRDVVWLNSDTEVFDYWLDRIMQIASDDAKIGTITPLSNNATICSYPKTLTDNFSPLELSDSTLDSYCWLVNKREVIDVPTGVGFCMYVRRRVLDKVGLLNEQVFKRGYGEENDLCQRILKAGYRNVVASGIFVRHYGAVSFKNETLQRQQEAGKALLKLHPDYDKDVQKWIARDPLQFSRIKLDCVRLRNQLFDNTNHKFSILHIAHRRGGGTEHFVQELTQSFLVQGVCSYILRSDDCGTMSLDAGDDHPNIKKLDLEYSYSALKLILTTLEITHIHIHSLVDFDISIIDLLITLCRELKIELVVSLHDYACCCPKLTMMKNDLDSCDNYGLMHCEACCKLWGTNSVWKLRNAYTRLFLCAEKVIVPSNDMKTRLEKIFKQVSFIVVPHFDKGQSPNTLIEQPLKKVDQITVAVIGAISDVKGSRLLLNYANEIKSKGLACKFILIGYSDITKDLIDAGVVVTGPYQSECEVTEHLSKYQVSAILIPSVCPETYSFTTSIALRTGLPIFVFDLGAPSERLKNLGLSDYVIPLKSRYDFKEILQKIIQGINNPRKYIFTGHSISVDDYYICNKKRN